MKAVVVGFGSIGRRHAAVLAELGINVAVVSRRDVGHARAFKAIDTALSNFNPDYIVIASRTHEHHKDLARLAELDFDGIVLIEKPLFDSVQLFPENRFKRIHVAFNMRFHPVVRALAQSMIGRRAIAMHAYVGRRRQGIVFA